MEKENLTSEETTEEDVVEAPEPVEGEEKETTEDEPSQTDYNAITEEEENRKADPDKATEAFKKREDKREEIDVEVPEEEKPLTRSETMSLIEIAQVTTNKALLENNAVSIVNTLSAGDEEAKAIMATWRNRVFPPDMALHEQLEEMQAIVNRKKNLSVNSELKRALKSKDNVSTDVAGTHRDSPESDEPKLSQADAQGMKSAGLRWDGVKRVWWKPIGRNQRYETKGPGQPHEIVDR